MLARIQIPPPPTQGYNLAELATHFQHQVLRLPGITVLAPTTMHSLLPPSYRTEELLPLVTESYDNVSVLMSSLTESQWKKLGSAQGLGKSDLSRKQQSNWELVFGNGLVITTPRSLRRLNDQPLLLPQQLNGLRLRMRRQAWLMIPREGRHENEARSRPVPSVLPLQDNDEPGVALPEPNYAQRRATLFPEVPARRKPSDLDTKSERLLRTISVEGARTVGELVARIGQSAGLVLYADARLEQLSVRPMSGSVRAGELLEALCWGLSGAVRRVTAKETTVYLLTNDRQGMGARMEALLDAIQTAQNQLSEARAQERESYAKRLHSDVIHFDTDDPLRPDAALLRFVRQPQPYSPDFSATGYRVPWNLLQGDLRRAAQARINAFNAGTLKNYPKVEYGMTYSDITPTSVHFQERFQLRALIPGLGERPFSSIRTNDFNTLPPAEQHTIPTHATIRLALFAPKTDDETRELVQRATQLPLLTGIVLETTPERLNLARRLAPISFPIYAAASVLRDSQSDVPPLPTINGEPSAWQELTARQRERVVERAKVVGLAGIVLHDLLPSEYLYGASREETVGHEVGFTPENRLALIQSHHYDPIDLNIFGFSIFPIQLASFIERAPTLLLFPHLPSTIRKDHSLAKPWNQLRAREAERFLTTLHQQLQAQLPTAKIIVQEVPFTTPRGLASVYEPVYYQPWSQPTKPPYEPTPYSEESPKEKPRATQLPPRWLSCDPADKRTLTNLLALTSQYSGCLFDLTRHSPEQALRVLETLRYEAP